MLCPPTKLVFRKFLSLLRWGICSCYSVITSFKFKAVEFTPAGMMSLPLLHSSSRLPQAYTLSSKSFPFIHFQVCCTRSFRNAYGFIRKLCLCNLEHSEYKVDTSIIWNKKNKHIPECIWFPTQHCQSSLPGCHPETLCLALGSVPQLPCREVFPLGLLQTDCLSGLKPEFLNCDAGHLTLLLPPLGHQELTTPGPESHLVSNSLACQWAAVAPRKHEQA